MPIPIPSKKAVWLCLVMPYEGTEHQIVGAKKVKRFFRSVAFDS